MSALLKNSDILHIRLSRKINGVWTSERVELNARDVRFFDTPRLLREETAIPWYELQFDCEIKKVGFIEADDGRFGCSPDGLLGDDAGIEIKCPEPIAHVKYLLGGVVPKDYVCQVHGSLYASGRKQWKFLSYRQEFPPFLVTVDRDEEIMVKIAAALAAFYKAYDEAMVRLETIARLEGFVKRKPFSMADKHPSQEAERFVENWRSTI